MFVLPSKSEVGVLSPEIAGEGAKVILSDGDVVTWSPPPPQPVMPDWSGIKSLQRYFNRRGHQVWPAWLYHPTEEARLVKNAQEAAELGVCYRQASPDELARYGKSQVWDWEDGSKWRPQPWGPVKFDPSRLPQGKNYVPAQRVTDPVADQNSLIAAVAAAVTQSLKATGAGPSRPAHVDATQWDEFIQFQAWKRSQEAVTTLADAAEREPVADEGAGLGEPLQAAPDGGTVLSALSSLAGEDEPTEAQPDEREHWLAEAERKGIKVDRRWGLDRLKAEVSKAA